VIWIAKRTELIQMAEEPHRMVGKESSEQLVKAFNQPSVIWEVGKIFKALARACQ